MESSTGYVLHRKLPSSIGGQLPIGNIGPLLSPSGESIIVSKYLEIQRFSRRVQQTQSPSPSFRFNLVTQPSLFLDSRRIDH